jgi:hypothetical protein
MFLLIHDCDCERCERCRSSLTKVGWLVEDSEGVRMFLCTSHLVELLHACQAPLQSISVEP